MAAGAVVILCEAPKYAPLAAIPVWLAWFYDRADGMLARRQGTVSAWGAWFDANVDELTDMAFQVAVAVALVRQVGEPWPWFLLVAFVVGKYLLMYGLMFEEQASPQDTFAQSSVTGGEPFTTEQRAACCASGFSTTTGRGSLSEWLRQLYHLPGNCDVRIHWLIVMLLLNQLAIELAAVALYYNLRWIVRYSIVWRRLGRQS